MSQDAGQLVRRPGPSVRTSLIVLVIGLVVVVPSIVGVVLPFVRTFTSPRITTPGSAHLHLGHGRYLVFQRTGTANGGSGFTFTHDQGVTLDPSEVTVIGPDGRHLEVTYSNGASQTITRGSQVYTAAVGFHVPASGVYDVQVQTPGRDEVLIARSLGETFRAVLRWVLTGIAGGLTTLVGVIMLIVGAVRRGRAGRTERTVQPVFAYPGPTPPGWYPDPGQPQRLRYWDGTRWTEHTN